MVWLGEHRYSVPCGQKRLPPGQVRAEGRIEPHKGVMPGSRALEQVKHPPQERSSWADYLAGMLQLAHEGTQLPNVAKLLHPPLSQHGSQVVKLLLREAQAHPYGVQLNTKEHQARHRTLQLLPCHWHSQPGEDLQQTL